MTCLWLGTQSKGGAVALAVSTIVVFAVPASACGCSYRQLVVVVLGAFAAVPLTEPWSGGTAVRRRRPPGRHGHARPRGNRAVAGFVYALVDRRLRIPDAARIWAGRVVLGLVCARLVAGAAGFFAAVDHRYARRRTAGTSSGTRSRRSSPPTSAPWARIATTSGSSLGTSSSVTRSPASAGTAGGTRTSSAEEPGDTLRAHSLELDALAETGIIGFLLVVGSGAAVLFGVARRARSSLLATGALGTVAYSRSTPEATGCGRSPQSGCRCSYRRIALSEDDPPPLSGRIAIPAGVVGVLVAILAFSPPWLSSRFVERAYDAPTMAEARQMISGGPDVSIRCPSTPGGGDGARRPAGRHPAAASRRCEGAAKRRTALPARPRAAGRGPKEDAPRAPIAVALAPRAERFANALDERVRLRTRPSRQGGGTRLGCLRAAAAADGGARRRASRANGCRRAGRRREGARTPPLARQAHGARAGRPPCDPDTAFLELSRSPRGTCTTARRPRPGSSPGSASSRVASA